MHIYLLIHSISSKSSKRKLENYIYSLVYVLSFEVENDCYTYEIQTNIHKKDLIKLFGFFVKKLSLNIDERVVLYDTNIFSSLLEKPSNNEKIILNGDVELENRIEEVIIEMFKYINFREVLEDVQKGYFDSLLGKQ